MEIRVQDGVEIGTAHRESEDFGVGLSVCVWGGGGLRREERKLWTDRHLID